MGGKEIGYSSGTIYSSGLREFLSLGCIDIAAAQLGNEVVVQWGDHGGEIKNIRTTVARFPYVADGRNSDLDVASTSTG
jgi:glycine cleavage system aminomethyltransferase T